MKGAATPTNDGVPELEALQQIGLLIDSASDARSAQDTEFAFTLLDQFAQRELAPRIIPLMHYFRANAWANREQLRSSRNEWAWEQTSVRNKYSNSVAPCDMTHLPGVGFSGNARFLPTWRISSIKSAASSMLSRLMIVRYA